MATPVSRVAELPATFKKVALTPSEVSEGELELEVEEFKIEELEIED